jgi:hypothetical protein
MFIYYSADPIYGTLVSKNKEKAIKFEAEVGRYSYNASTGIITYTVTRDSVLNYDTEKFTVYQNNKHFYDHENATYTENAKFSKLTNGKRNWITKDTYLQSLTSEKIDITFDMGTDNPTPNN